MKKNPALNQVVVLGAGINGLGIIRSFAKTQIPVVAMSWYKDYGMYSRFCEGKICPNPLNEKALIEFLVDYAGQKQFKPVLFATSDLFLMPVVKHKKTLAEYYHIPVCDWDVLKPLIKKEYLYAFAEENRIPCPKTYVVRKDAELDEVEKYLSFPLILKPSVNIEFSKLLGEKAFILNSKSEFLEIKAKILKTDLCSKGLIFQEFIPGNVDDLYTITSYTDKSHQIQGYSIGHKIRQYPPETGTIVSGRIKHVNQILESAETFMKASRFYGISNIEFKRDERDGTYKLMEINPRTGVWNSSALACGINLPLMAYKDILGEKIQKESNHSKSLVWLIGPLDFYYSIWGYKSKGYPDYSNSFFKWFKSIKGDKVEATFKWNDMMPFIRGFFMKYR